MALIADLKTPVNLNHNSNSTRFVSNMQAYPLGEQGMPVNNLPNVLNFLGVAAPSHLRYTPTSTETFCNIYAYDVCNLMNRFIPRVWWVDTAISAINNGHAQSVQYGITVAEMTANNLFGWFGAYGHNFGWTNVADADTLQNQVNNSQSIGIIVAKNAIGHGHITVVVPESISAIKAVRNAAGKVINPLQSQAGEQNFEFGHLGNTNPWWLPSNFTTKFYH